MKLVSVAFGLMMLGSASHADYVQIGIGNGAGEPGGYYNDGGFGQGGFNDGAFETTTRQILGSTEIMGKTDQDILDIRSCARQGVAVTALKLRVAAGNPVDIYRAQVQFGNGEVRELNVSGRYWPGQGTQWVRFARPRCVARLAILANGAGGRSYINVVGITTPHNQWND